MAESSFDPAAFEARLATRRLGQSLVARAAVDSTNDVAWEGLGQTGAHGRVVVADAQLQGRGRAGRVWHSAPGRGLALSLLLTEGLDRRPVGVVPLAAGVALARALERLSARVTLKWPNDALLGAAKVAGVLVEARIGGDAAAPRGLVVGLGVNVTQRAEDFPPELRRPSHGRAATSLALAGVDTTREVVAAEWLNAFEPLWDDLETRGAAPLLAAWESHAALRGERVVASTPSGPVAGVARGLDAEGRLVLALDDGGVATITAGDVESEGAAGAGRGSA